MFFSITASWPPRELVKDFLFSKRLKLTNPPGHINKANFKKLQEIERKIIAPEELVYSKMKSVRDLRKFVSCFDNSQIDCYFDDGCFMLCVKFYSGVELYDIRSENESYGKIFKAIEHIAARYAEDEIYTYSREKTTYPLYQLFYKKGFIDITMDETDESCNDKHHRLIFTVTDKFKKRITKKER